MLPLLCVTIIAVLVRFHNLGFPTYVCWDETHFGKMSGYYVNGTYFVDVHPPLGKLIIAAIGWFNGYNGLFDFNKPGDSYLSSASNEELVPYVAMRFGCASFGVLTVVVVYMTILLATNSNAAAVVTAVMMVCDTGLLVLSRLILLDSVMLFFIFATLLFAVNMSVHQNWHEQKLQNDKSFTTQWWVLLLSNGICLGAAASIKLVGWFLVVYIGLWTIAELWNLLRYIPDLGISYFIKHVLSRVIGLILLPILVYFAVFSIHFYCLWKDGPGAFYHSSLFQTSLKDNILFNQTATSLSAESIVVVRNNDVDGCYLHSHNLMYPSYFKTDESAQQITGYMQRDGNNLWKLAIIKNGTKVKVTNILSNGDVITLHHLLTLKRLNLIKKSHHWISAPLTKWSLLVAGQNHCNEAQSDQWKVQIVGTGSTQYLSEPLTLLSDSEELS